jgi:imidazole glycerol-phosphate synthase subunit HisF
MLTVRIVPCLDVKGGRVVKGIRFSGLRDAGCPVERASLYEAQGADELVVLDVAATPEARGTRLETVRRVRSCLSIPLTVGGGVRSVENAAELLENGADKVALNTAAVERPELLGEIASRFGRQCTVLALDAACRERGSGWEVVVRSGTVRTGRDAVAWARDAEAAGAGEILLTSWDRDGTRSGYDLELIAAITQAVRIPVIASGGAANASDLVAAVQAGAHAVLAASLFHDNDSTVGSVKRELLAAGLSIRPLTTEGAA